MKFNNIEAIAQQTGLDAQKVKEVLVLHKKLESGENQNLQNMNFLNVIAWASMVLVFISVSAFLFATESFDDNQPKTTALLVSIFFLGVAAWMGNWSLQKDYRLGLQMAFSASIVLVPLLIWSFVLGSGYLE